MNLRFLGRIAAGAVALLVLASVTADAQGWNYPSMMYPRIVQRQYGFVIANGGDDGTALLGQWREGISPDNEFSFEVGFADPDGGDTRFIVGAALAHQLTRSSMEMPLDMVLSGGVYPSVGGDLTLIRIPIQLSMGHRFPLEGGNGNMAITPFIDPRISFDLCSGDVCPPDDDSDISINFDVGASLDLTSRLTLIAAIGFPGGDFFDDNSFGFSLAWRPSALGR
jgi:hypothetical protein